MIFFYKKYIFWYEQIIWDIQIKSKMLKKNDFGYPVFEYPFFDLLISIII